MNSTNEQNDKLAIDPKLQRYAKQIRFPSLGTEGQEKIGCSKVVVIGCGALGSVSANLLARSGVGELVIIDRDFVELDNLQRQVLYDETDVGMPKAIVASRRLSKVNSEIRVKGIITDVDYRNIESFLIGEKRADIVIDGSDNFEIRFLINDACVKHRIPWIYGGCLGAEGQLMNILPGETACLNCLMMDGPPAPGTTATCDSGGILSTIINVVASLQVNEAIKLLSGNRERMNRKLQVFDLWANRSHSVDISTLRDKVDCPTCKQNEFIWLNGKRGSQSAVLCGRNAVQVSFPERTSIDLNQLAKRLANVGEVHTNEFLVKLCIGEFEIHVFQDSRAIIRGTEDMVQAKKLYTQYIGS